ncbi:hypothetical protein SteCoe_37345 [Stentor coeruleus]|uniref:Uncharacterized protein n=1 Tax=Stentor coeruleus TaxID=5963 RepID=A0A1R2AN60_9CILI|nr:hypothetical protein SteCoe_37345 [Stentor coeruleus]
MVYCKCSKKYIFLCTMHLQDHLDEKSEADHPIKILYKKIAQDHKADYIESLHILLNITESTLNVTKLSLQSAIDNLKNLDMNIENYFNNQISSLQKMIAAVTTENKEINIPGYERSTFADPSFKQHILRVKEKAIRLREKLTFNIKEIVEFLPNIKSNYQEDVLDFNGNANLDEHLYYFKKETKIFVQFNLDELTQKTYDMNVNEPQGTIAAVCQVPDKKVFYCGGHSPNLNTTYLIDLKTWKAEALSECRVRCQTTATYFNGFVYIFGGYSGSASLNNCDKFDLVNKRWINLVNRAFTTFSVNVLPYPSFFILTGYGANAFWKYDIEGDNYQRLSYTFEVCYNLFFRENGIAYFITKKDLYVCYDKDGNNWTKSLKCLSMDCINHTSKPVARGRNIYFVSAHTNQILKFHLETLDLHLVATI